MPRASREQVEIHRALIQSESIRLFKERGINGVSVAEIMSGAGLTHGGFYGHFSSKDELAKVACLQAFEESAERWKALDTGDADEATLINILAKHYLTAKQRDDMGNGCPTTGFAVDVSREDADKPVKQAYVQGIKGLIDVLISFSKHRRSKRVRQQALARLSIMVGAVTLARAVRGGPLADEFLVAARDYLAQDAQNSAAN